MPATKPPALPGVKETVSLRIDRDVLDFFQEEGPGWQDRINAALRKAAGKQTASVFGPSQRSGRSMPGIKPGVTKRMRMRQKNMRLVIVGVVLMVAAPAFFFFFLNMASKSNDPAALMQTVGQVAGVVGAIGLVMLVFGLVGKKR